VIGDIPATEKFNSNKPGTPRKKGEKILGKRTGYDYLNEIRESKRMKTVDEGKRTASRLKCNPERVILVGDNDETPNKMLFAQDLKKNYAFEDVEAAHVFYSSKTFPDNCPDLEEREGDQ